MIEVKRYQATDGSIWDTQTAATARDHLIRVVAEAMSPLGPWPSDPGPGCRFGNGDFYQQHDPAAVELARSNLLKITRKSLAWWFQDQVERHGHEPTAAHPSWFCRLLDRDDAESKAWGRLWCIDGQGREWGQPYFAEHPNEAAEALP